MRNWVRRVHFVGIGGAGMSGIAQVLSSNLKFEASGLDSQESTNPRRLNEPSVVDAMGGGGRYA